ncbi:MAG: hypothetical protein R3C60_00525 [Parvularculaceae bacterium]
MTRALDSALARLQWLTLVEIAILVVGGAASILTREPWPALTGLAAAYLFSRFVSSRPTRSTEKMVREEFEE